MWDTLLQFLKEDGAAHIKLKTRANSWIRAGG